MKDKLPEISIIVPVYNVRQYLRQCLDSIISQDFRQWECVLVDDGSTDGSSDIVDEYAARDARFVAVHRQNGGLSAARNTGLDHARGRYIGFVDSDDWIEPQMYEVLYQCITDHHADMSQVGVIKDYQGMSHRKPLTDSLRVLGHDELVVRVYSDAMPSYACNKLFRREAITEQFPVGKSFEDMYILSHWIQNIQKGVLSPKPLYHYRQRASSLSHAKSPANRLQYFESCVERDRTLSVVTSGLLSQRRRDRIMWKSALRAARVIARMGNIPKQERIDCLRKIRQYCVDASLEPSRKTLGLAKYLQARLLFGSPTGFIRMAQALYHLDFHSKYRRQRAYD